MFHGWPYRPVAESDRSAGEGSRWLIDSVTDAGLARARPRRAGQEYRTSVFADALNVPPGVVVGELTPASRFAFAEAALNAAERLLPLH
jgi:hypothetical protein